MAFQDYFGTPIAYDPTTGELVKDATFTVHAVDDVALATPLATTDPASGVTIDLTSSSVGVLPDFRAAGDPAQVILKSGAFVTKITSVFGAVLAAGLDPATVAAATAAAAAAEDAQTGAEAAKLDAEAASAALTPAGVKAAATVALAENPAIVTSAAAQAATLAASSAGLVPRGDVVLLADREPRTSDATSVVVMQDAGGEPLLDVDLASGTPAAAGKRFLQAGVGVGEVEPRFGQIGKVDLAGRPDWTGTDPSTGAPMQDAIDAIALSRPSVRQVIGKYTLHDPVYVVPRASAARRMTPRRNLMVVGGESHASNLAAGFTTAMPSTTVVNRAIGGTNVWEAGVRLGALSPVLTTVPNLPSSGSVTCQAEGYLATSESTPLTMVTTGTLYVRTAAGEVPVRGNIQRVADGGNGLAWQFTVTSGGPVTSITSAYFVSDDPSTYDGALLLLGSAINASITNPGVGTLGDAIGQVVAGTAAIIDAWRVWGGQIALIGSLTRSASWPIVYPLSTLQDGNRATGPLSDFVVRESEKELQRCWPDLYIDNRRYVQETLIYDLGITPATSDLVQILNDCPPPAILQADGQHLTTAAAAQDALWLTNTHLKPRKLVL